MKKLLFKNAAKNVHEEKAEAPKVEESENEETLSGLLVEPFFFGRKGRLPEEGGDPIVDFEVYYGFATGFATMSEATILAVAIDADGKVLAKQWADGESHEDAQAEGSTAKNEAYKINPSLRQWLKDAAAMGLARLRQRNAPPRSGVRHSYTTTAISCRVGTFV